MPRIRHLASGVQLVPGTPVRIIHSDCKGKQIVENSTVLADGVSTRASLPAKLLKDMRISKWYIYNPNNSEQKQPDYHGAVTTKSICEGRRCIFLQCKSSLSPEEAKQYAISVGPCLAEPVQAWVSTPQANIPPQSSRTAPQPLTQPTTSSPIPQSSGTAPQPLTQPTTSSPIPQPIPPLKPIPIKPITPWVNFPNCYYCSYLNFFQQGAAILPRSTASVTPEDNMPSTSGIITQRHTTNSIRTPSDSSSDEALTKSKNTRLTPPSTSPTPSPLAPKVIVLSSSTTSPTPSPLAPEVIVLSPNESPTPPPSSEVITLSSDKDNE